MILGESQFEYIEVFYNRSRCHSTLGYSSPVRFFEDWISNNADRNPRRHEYDPLEGEIRQAPQSAVGSALELLNAVTEYVNQGGRASGALKHLSLAWSGSKAAVKRLTEGHAVLLLFLIERR